MNISVTPPPVQFLHQTSFIHGESKKKYQRLWTNIQIVYWIIFGKLIRNLIIGQPFWAHGITTTRYVGKLTNRVAETPKSLEINLNKNIIHSPF